MDLAEQATTEQDPEIFMALIREIDELLAKKQDRLDHLRIDPKPQS